MESSNLLLVAPSMKIKVRLCLSAHLTIPNLTNVGKVKDYRLSFDLLPQPLEHLSILLEP
jgi:hypothetical protein